METKQLHNFLNYRKFAEPRLDEAMDRISPGTGWVFDTDGTPRLADLMSQRLLLDKQPTTEQSKALLGFRVECALRGDADFCFAFNGDLYLHAEGHPYRRLHWNETSLEWENVEIPFTEWMQIEAYVKALAPSEADRAAKAKEDMERLAGEMSKPAGPIKEG